MSDLPTITEDERPWRGSYEWLSRRLEQALADKARETERADALARRLTVADVYHRTVVRLYSRGLHERRELRARLDNVREIHRKWGDTEADTLDQQALWEDLMHALGPA